jgi:hypothetical protein
VVEFKSQYHTHTHTQIIQIIEGKVINIRYKIFKFILLLEPYNRAGGVAQVVECLPS